MAEHEPDPIERMAKARQNALAADWGAREWFQLATTEEREASVRAMLAAVRELVAAIQHKPNYVGMTCQLLDLIEEEQKTLQDNVTETATRSKGKGE